MTAPEPAGRPYYPRDFPPHLRATDAHRDAVAEVVRAAVGDGRLSVAEMDARIDQVYESKTHGELAGLVEDLVIFQPQLPLAPRVPAGSGPPVSDRKILIGFVLCFFFGSLGVHRFYAGRNGSAVAMLLITVLTLGMGVIITGIWSLIDLIILAVGGFRDGRSRLMREWT